MHEKLQIDGVGQIALRVKDLERATAFYRDTLGLAVLSCAPDGGAYFDCGGVRLLLDPRKDVDDDSGSLIFFRVPDLRAAYRTLYEQGVNISVPALAATLDDREVWTALFLDSERNPVGLLSDVPTQTWI